MERGLDAELSPREGNTLFRITNGDNRSGFHNASHVARLQKRGLIEYKGPFVDMTALGGQRVLKLQRPGE